MNKPRSVDFKKVVQDYKKDRDQEQFKKIYDGLRYHLIGFINKYVKDIDVSHDIFNDVMTVIYQKIDRYDSKFSFLTWSYTISKNACMSYLYKKNRNPVYNYSYLENMDEDSAVTYSLGQTESSYEMDFTIEDTSIMESVIQLPEIYMDAVIDHYFLGLKYHEIAKRRGLNIQTVKNRLHVGKKKLKLIYK